MYTCINLTGSEPPYSCLCMNSDILRGKKPGHLVSLDAQFKVISIYIEVQIFKTGVKSQVRAPSNQCEWLYLQIWTLLKKFFIEMHVLFSCAGSKKLVEIYLYLNIELFWVVLNAPLWKFLHINKIYSKCLHHCSWSIFFTKTLELININSSHSLFLW